MSISIHSYASTKSIVLAKMISGRYRTEMMCRFWSQNRNGVCLFGTCKEVCEDLEHMLVVCPLYTMLSGKGCIAYGNRKQRIVNPSLDLSKESLVLPQRPKSGLYLTFRPSPRSSTWSGNMVERLRTGSCTWPGPGPLLSTSTSFNVLAVVSGWKMIVKTISWILYLLFQGLKGDRSLPVHLLDVQQVSVQHMSSTTTPSLCTPSTSSQYPVAGTSGQDLAIAASNSDSLACSNTLSQQDQPPVPVVVQAPCSNIVHHQPVSSSVGINGDQLGGGEGHVAAGCGSGAWAS